MANNDIIVGACGNLAHHVERLERAPNRKGTFKCRECGQRSGGEVYYCFSCKYYVCLECVDLGKVDVLGCGGHPDHALEFLEEAPYPPTHAYGCNLCGKGGIGAVYHCNDCQFDLHEHCAEIDEEITFWAHPHHQLSLLPEFHYRDTLQMNVSICDGCEEPLSDTKWVYRCEDVNCDYDLHALCAKHPRKLKHPSHPHELTLVQKSRTYQKDAILQCDGCKTLLRGLHYHCAQCRYDLHPTCAIIPHRPIHRDSTGPEHRLSLLYRAKKDKVYKCAQCGEKCTSWLYYCATCNCSLHTTCVTKPYEDGLDDLVSELNGMGEVELDDKQQYSSGTLYSVDEGEDEDEDESDDEVQPALKDLYRLKSIQEKLNMRCNKLAEDDMSTFTQQPSVHTNTHDPTTLIDMMENMTFQQAEQNRSRIITDPAQPAHAPDLYAEAMANLKELVLEKYSMLNAKLDAIQANQMHKHQRKVPRILLCTTKDRSFKQKLVTKLVPGIKAVQLHLLCEQHGHEHMVQDSQGCEMNLEVGDRWKKLFPLLLNGFRVLSFALSVGAHFGLGISNLVSDPHQLLQDVNASLVHFGNTSVSCGSSGQEVASSDDIADAIQKAESSAAEQWLVDFLKGKSNILNDFGLQRIVYKRSVGPNRLGHIAWLCDPHLHEGLKAGYLERFAS